VAIIFTSLSVSFPPTTFSPNSKYLANQTFNLKNTFERATFWCENKGDPSPKELPKDQQQVLFDPFQVSPITNPLL
jgi:hypothetical protein